MAAPKKPITGPWHLELDRLDSDANNDYYRLRLEFDREEDRNLYGYPIVPRVDRDNALEAEVKRLGYVGWHDRSTSILALWKPE